MHKDRPRSRPAAISVAHNKQAAKEARATGFCDEPRTAGYRQQVAGLLAMIFVKAHEIAESDWKFHVLIRIEGIESHRVLESGDDESET